MAIRFSIKDVLRSIKNVFKRDTRPVLPEARMGWLEMDWYHIDMSNIVVTEIDMSKIVVVDMEDTLS